MKKGSAFPKLSQREMAHFLAIKPVRLEWATHEKIVERGEDGFYHPEVVTPAWLAYERSPRARGRRKSSEFEKQRARLTAAKADAAERRLAVIDHALVGTQDIIEKVKVVCLRIRNKLVMSIPRLARSCYSAPSVSEAVLAARREFDVVLAELSALEDDGSSGEFEVVAVDEKTSTAQM